MTMSDAPTSAVDQLNLKAAIAAGWSLAEVEWEAKQEQAASLAHDNRLEEAAEIWRAALPIARSAFGANDPRLATSLANLAYSLRESQDEAAATLLFQEAKRCWDASWTWLAQLRIEGRARSSLYHLRMELRHREQYEKNARKRLDRFAAEAREAFTKLAGGGPPPQRGLERWRSEKPPVFNDQRKLLAACLLLVSRPERRN
jgi:hypothetical protein